MIIKSVELREIRLPLVRFFETSFGRTVERRILLVKLEGKEAPGYGECTAAEEPLYNSETTDTAWHVISEFIVPLILGRELGSALETSCIWSQIRGHQMAKAAVETALWDMEARARGLPLSTHLGGQKNEIPCGVSIGIQESLKDLMNEVTREVEAGYRRIKIKIRPGWEVEPVRAIRAEFPDIQLMVDANSAFGLDDSALFERLDQFGLMMIEQPLAHDDIVDHAALQKLIRTPICLDESIHHAEDVRKAVEMGSCRIINVKLGRVGGYREVLRINEYCVRNGVPMWCGGMLESGIGRAHNIAMSTLSGFTLPGDVSASKRYYAEDTVQPPVEVTARGTIPVPTGVGIGYMPNMERIERATVRSRVFKPGKTEDGTSRA